MTRREGRNSQCTCLPLPNDELSNTAFIFLKYYLLKAHNSWLKELMQHPETLSLDAFTWWQLHTQGDIHYFTEETTHLGDREPQVGNVHVLFQRHCDPVW